MKKTPRTVDSGWEGLIRWHKGWIERGWVERIAGRQQRTRLAALVLGLGLIAPCAWAQDNPNPSLPSTIAPLSNPADPSVPSTTGPLTPTDSAGTAGGIPSQPTSSTTAAGPSGPSSSSETALHPFGPSRLQAAPFEYQAEEGEPNPRMGADRALARRCAIVSQIMAEKDDPIGAALAEGQAVSVPTSQVRSVKHRAYVNAQLRAQKMAQCMAQANDDAGPITILGVLIGQAALVQAQAIRLQLGTLPAHALSPQERGWELHWAEQTQIWFEKSIAALPKPGPDTQANANVDKAQEAIVDLAALFDEGDYILMHPKRPARMAPLPSARAGRISNAVSPHASTAPPAVDLSTAQPSSEPATDSEPTPSELGAASVPTQPLEARASKRREEARKIRSIGTPNPG